MTKSILRMALMPPEFDTRDSKLYPFVLSLSLVPAFLPSFQSSENRQKIGNFFRLNQSRTDSFPLPPTTPYGFRFHDTFRLRVEIFEAAWQSAKRETQAASPNLRIS